MFKLTRGGSITSTLPVVSAWFVVNFGKLVFCVDVVCEITILICSEVTVAAAYCFLIAHVLP